MSSVEDAEAIHRDPQKGFAVRFLVEILPTVVSVLLGLGRHIEHRLGA